MFHCCHSPDVMGYNPQLWINPLSPELLLSGYVITERERTSEKASVVLLLTDAAINLLFIVCDLLQYYLDKLLSQWKKPERLQRMRGQKCDFQSQVVTDCSEKYNVS